MHVNRFPFVFLVQLGVGALSFMAQLGDQHSGVSQLVVPQLGEPIDVIGGTSAGTLENDAGGTDQAKRQRIALEAAQGEKKKRCADTKLLSEKEKNTATERWATVQQLYGSVENFMVAVTLGGLQAVMREIEELEEESSGTGKESDQAGGKGGGGKGGEGKLTGDSSTQGS